MELYIPKMNPKKLASLLAKDPEKHMARLEPTHDIAAFMLVSESPYFQFLPEEFKGAETALAAVMHCGSALKRIPAELKTPELCLEAARDGSYGWRHDLCPLAFIPENVLTPEMCLAAAQANGRALRHIPADMMTAGMVEAAVQTGSFSLSDIPDELKTPELCLAAVKRQAFEIEHVPDSMKTKEMCLLALEPRECRQ